MAVCPAGCNGHWQLCSADGQYRQQNPELAGSDDSLAERQPADSVSRVSFRVTLPSRSLAAVNLTGGRWLERREAAATKPMATGGEEAKTGREKQPTESAMPVGNKRRD